MNDFGHQFFDLGQQQLPLSGDYNLWLVGLSYLVAFVASLSALRILDRAHGHRSPIRRRGWVAATAVTAGIGVWSMHFIGMVAFQLPISVSHSVGLTLISIVPAIVGNFIAYSIHLYSRRLKALHRSTVATEVSLTLSSGTALGLGIGLMHYIGMAAMVMPAHLRYHPGWFVGSIIVAVALGVLAMSTYHGYRSPDSEKGPSRRVRVLTALIIAAAISGMHYVAMLAARFYADDRLAQLAVAANQNHYWLIYAIAIAVIIIAVVAWLSSVVDRRLQQNQREIRQSGKRIRELAYNDTLTGLPNRRSLLDYLNSQQGNVPKGQCLALFLIDIDKFKVLNNTLGPTLGDTLLQSVTHRLERLPLDIHLVARPSSNEFAAVARIRCDGNPAKAQSLVLEMAADIQRRLEQPYSLRDYRHRCSMSIGMTLLSKESKSADEVLVQAALALAEAKRTGLGQIQLFHPKMADAIERRVTMEADLRWALENDQQLQLYLQPQLNSERKIIGAEALIRWHHPQQGIISPAEFIPLAEETGLIISLGDWVNQQACKIINQWQQLDLGHLVLSINVSSPQFQQHDFVDKLNTLIREHHIPAGRLKIELTESVLMQNVDEVIGKINELKQLGIQFALDDFGTGYSSLSYLMKLPFDVLKIDVSFVRDMLSSPQKDAIVRTIVQLSHNLGLQVVAEGVETEQHFAHLQMLGCDCFQGYLFSHPVVASQFQQQAIA